MESYYLYFVLLVFLFVVIGIPLIVGNVQLKKGVKLREIGDSELSGESFAAFKEVDAKAAPMFFMPFKNFSAQIMKNSKDENRLYLSSDNSTALTATFIMVKERKNLSMEFTTLFTDGFELNTNNHGLSNVFVQPDWTKVYKFPGLQDLNKLYENHRRRVYERVSKGASIRATDRGKVFEEIEQTQDKMIEYQAKKGLLKITKKGDYYAATPLVALRGIFNFLNPLADDFSHVKFIFAIFPAAAVPALWIIWSVSSGLSESLISAIPVITAEKAHFVLFYPSFIISGVIIGILMPHKAFLWGFLATLPAIILFKNDLHNPLFLSILSSISAETAHDIRNAIKWGGQEWKKALNYLFGLIAATIYFYWKY